MGVYQLTGEPFNKKPVWSLLNNEVYKDPVKLVYDDGKFLL